MQDKGYDCRIKFFVDRPDKDVHTLWLTTTYNLQGQMVCEVDKGIKYVTVGLSVRAYSKLLYFSLANLRNEVLWTEGPFPGGKINWGFSGLQGQFRTDYKCKITSRNDLSTNGHHLAFLLIRQPLILQESLLQNQWVLRIACPFQVFLS